MSTVRKAILIVLCAVACSLASAVLPVIIDSYLPDPEFKPVSVVARLPFTPKDYPEANVMWVRNRPGLVRESTVRGIGIEDSWHVERTTAGWPIRMLEGGDYYEFHNTGGRPATAEMHPVWMYQWHSGKHLWRFPLRPIPLAVVANLAFWVLICATFAWGVPALKRWRRRSTGRCQSCGYPAADAGPCPECGEGRTARA